MAAQLNLAQQTKAPNKKARHTVEFSKDTRTGTPAVRPAVQGVGVLPSRNLPDGNSLMLLVPKRRINPHFGRP